MTQEPSSVRFASTIWLVQIVGAKVVMADFSFFLSGLKIRPPPASTMTLPCQCCCCNYYQMMNKSFFFPSPPLPPPQLLLPPSLPSFLHQIRPSRNREVMQRRRERKRISIKEEWIRIRTNWLLFLILSTCKKKKETLRMSFFLFLPSGMGGLMDDDQCNQPDGTAVHFKLLYVPTAVCTNSFLFHL